MPCCPEDGATGVGRGAGWWLAASSLFFVLVATGGCRSGEYGAEGYGTLELRIVDAETGEPAAARVELLDEHGRAVVPEAALAVFSDCGKLPLHAWVPGFDALQTAWSRHREVPNPYSGTTQFYTDGVVEARLPAGRYSVRVAKGMEFEEARGTVVVKRGEVASLQLELVRWIDLAEEGWYSADDHPHIPRPSRRFDPLLATWMEAEGLQVANLLQMGLARDVHITPQAAFGPGPVYRRGDTLILSGQENPRTHLLGHAIVLGAGHFIDLPQEYLLYDRVLEEAHRQGAVTGYAHWGLGGAEDGLALWGHDGLLDFVEVLNLGFPFYDRWYEALDLGIPVGPTAGTDYPCLPSLPGRERFYARLETLSAESWLEAVRRGRTFVTNGPAVELLVEGVGPGEELTLEEPGEVRVRGLLRFDPDRDAVAGLELILGGEVAERIDTSGSEGEVRLETTLPIERTSWVALRARGEKRGETEIDLQAFFAGMLVFDRASTAGLLESLPKGPVPRPSAAHTGAIWITVAGTAPLAEQPRGREAARLWLSRLAEFEGRLADDQMQSWANFPGRGDGVGPGTARANRPVLREAIEGARRHYAGLTPRSGGEAVPE